MSELLEIQRDLANSLRDSGAPSPASRWLAGDAALQAQRLAIYRGNVAASVAKALGAAYPVIRQVVSPTRFDHLARDYRQRVPSSSGDLFDYGAAFAEFLAGDALAPSLNDLPQLPYLSDLARLEWAVHRAYGAADAKPWDPQTLAQIAPAHQAGICFEWAAGAAIVHSAYPIVRIWQLHQSDCDRDFNVDWNVCESAGVMREGLRVVVSVLGPGDSAFMASSLGGATLGASAESALAADSRFDLGRLLARAMASNAICGLTLHLQKDHPE